METRKSPTYRYVPCDKERLYEACRKRNLSVQDMSIKCGMAPSYLSNSSNRDKRISEPVALLLKAYYNIEPEEYAPISNQSEPIVQTVIQKQELEIDYDKLYQTMYKATYDALVNARQEMVDKSFKKREIAPSKTED